MTYDERTHTTSNPKGIYTRMPGFLRTDTNKLVTTTKFVNPYFNKFVKRLLEEGYILELSLRSAMYDFRKGPSKFLQLQMKSYESSST